MTNDPKGTQRTLSTRWGQARAVREPQPDAGDLVDAIGYEAADPSLQAAQWFEAMHSEPTPRDGP